MAKFNKSHILIVDDNPLNILTLEVVLKPLGQYLVYAYSGKEALKQVLKYDFSVILMDAHMPELDGFETVKLIRTRLKCRYTPIIFISAFHQDEIDIAQGYEIGAVDYIFKPINPKILYSKVQVFVDLFTKSIHTQTLQNELKRRRQVEKELKHLAQRMQAILESAGEGIYGLNHQGIITFANPAAASILGWEINELIGQPLSVMLNIDGTEGKKECLWKKDPLFLALKSNTVYHNDDGIFCKKDGTKIPVEYTISYKQPKHLMKYPGSVVVFKDISRRKEAEKLAFQHQYQLTLAHNARLSSLGEMASALAHELNQPLAAIANYTRGCIRRLQAKPNNANDILFGIEQAACLAERAGKIVHRIKDFARKGKLHYERVYLNELISDMNILINYEIKGSAIQIVYVLADVPILVMVDKIQFEQCLLNLLRNGIEAMSQLENSHQKQITIQTHLIENENSNHLVEININDTGPGFSEEIIDKLFDLYFTTKHDGMGMGLSICRTIIEAHGGSIFAKNQPGGGAWLQITLPLVNTI